MKPRLAHRLTIALVGTSLMLATVSPRTAVADTAQAARPSDFNGDGYADLAIGASWETVGSKVGAGTVTVLYGRHAGISAAGNQRWTQDSPGVKGKIRNKPNNGERFGHAIASGDFDRDGYADLAVGVPGDRAGGVKTTGAVNVLYGSKRGLTATGDQRWSQGNLPGTPMKDDEFGRALASADFDGDGYWDLAIGVPGEHEGTLPQVGSVQILLGGPDGLRAAGAVTLTRSMTGTADIPIVDHWFGYALGVGDLNGDGLADLAVGAPGAGYGPGGDASVFLGSPDGPTADGSQLWSQASPGIEDDLNSRDRFGSALAIGDFDADGFGDLAIGVPREGLGTEPPGLAGRVNVLYGSSDGPTAARSQNWHRDVPGMPNAYGQFGSALASGDFDGDGYLDLAIGVPIRLGAVVALYGGPSGLNVAGVQLWTQASPGVPGTKEKRDQFGASLAAANYGHSGRDDLAIGVPGETFGRVESAGMVNVLYGRVTGLSGKHAQGWSQDSPGVRGTSERDDFFGSSLTP